MFKMICPPFLKKGDKIGIVAPARKITKDELTTALEIIESKGYIAVYNDDLFADYNQFAGNSFERASYLQMMLDDNEIKAIMFARGGYGTVKIIDLIDFSGFVNNPKWLIGYSDITVILNHIASNFGIMSLHASMPINFGSNTDISISYLYDIIEGKRSSVTFSYGELSRTGNADGILLGGNLSVLYSIMGSSSFPDTNKTILFIEDLDEYLYHIDRMMMGLKRAGLLKNLAGLIIGGMSDMNDNEVPYGLTAEQIIREAVDDYHFPVYFGYPAGHLNNNLPLIIGARVSVSCQQESKVRVVYSI